MRVLIFSLIASTLFSGEVASSKDLDIRYGNPPSFSGDQSIRSFLYGEPLFASIREEGTAFAIRSSGTSLQGKVIEPPVRWRPGFRVGGGVHFDHDAWEGSVDWTYFNTAYSHSIQGEFITPLFIDATSYSRVPGGFFQRANEQWAVSFSALRFLLSRPYLLSRELAVEPLFGLFSVWINQDLIIIYRSKVVEDFGVWVVQTKIENDAWRVGPLVGANLNWYVREGLWIVGAAQGALLYRNLSSQQEELSIGYSGQGVRMFLKETNYSIQPWVDCQMGVGWGTYFGGSRNHIEVKLLYEAQYFWRELFSRILYQQVEGSLNHFINNFGDLSMQSASLRIRIDF